MNARLGAPPAPDTTIDVDAAFADVGTVIPA
jgi:hypothetical protein